MTHDINYIGPNGKYIPPSGEHIDNSVPSTLFLSPIATYADISYLNNILPALIAQTTSLQTILVNQLQTMSLAVTTDPNDANLNNANEVLWPSALGAAPPYVSFLYYQSLASNSSAAAKSIRAAYETAARGVTGDNAIDLLPIVQMTLDEADLMQNFADTNAGTLSDSSQRRTVELLQDWVEAAAVQMTNVQSQFDNQGSTSLNTTDVNQLAPSDASNAQAVMQVNMNQLNMQIVKSQGVLSQFFANYQSTFYNNILGPAISFRNNVTTSLLPTLPSSIHAIVNPSTSILNTQLQSVIQDQMRRNDVYVSRVNDVLANVQARDAYRSYIVQLGSVGQTVSSGTSGTIVTSTDTPDQAAFFQASTAPDATPSNPYLAPHSQLSGLDDPAAHSQYIDRFGDTMIGNLLLVQASDDNPNGALIDGMKPSTHAHTGQDGTVQIESSNIIEQNIITIPTYTPGATGFVVNADRSTTVYLISISTAWTASLGPLSSPITIVARGSNTPVYTNATVVVPAGWYLAITGSISIVAVTK